MEKALQNKISNTEATSLEYKHVVFRKPYCSATEKSGVDFVQNVEKRCNFYQNIR
jgi:hypothetical protein